MKIISIDTVKKDKVNMPGAIGAWKQLPLSVKDGAPLYSYRVFTIEPNGNTPYHKHDFEHMNYIISGEGALVDEQGNEISLKTGDFALVLPDEMHQYRNTSNSIEFVMICGVPIEYE